MPDLEANDKVQLIVDGQQALQAILAGIQQAQQLIHVKMFMWRDDALGNQVLQALAEKIASAPQLKVVIEKDIFGSRVYNLSRFFSLGRKGGDIFDAASGQAFLKRYATQVTFTSVGAKSFLFFKLLRENDHSKVWVFDPGTPQSSALLGGMNIADEYLTAPNHADPDQGGWHDYMLLLRGELADRLLSEQTKPRPRWLGKRLRRGVEIWWNLKERRFMKQQLLREMKAIQESIIIQHGYLTDDTIIRRLRKLARHGIRVEVMLPDRSDGALHANLASIHKLLRPDLLPHKENSRVRVYLYRGMLHAKVIVLDATTAIIGSANLTPNSFDYLNEINAVIREPSSVVQTLLQQIESDKQFCQEITPSNQPRYNRLRAWVEKLFI